MRRVDHYIPFAMHFYALIYAVLAARDETRAAAYRERARIFAGDIRHWFGPDGAALPFGRSQTYRFAAGGFWEALAFAGVEALPWPAIKGYYMRHIGWWSKLPIADRDGVLSIGLGYPNLVWHGQTDVSAIIDLLPHPSRSGHAMSPIANSNLIQAKTLLPQLRGDIGPGTTILAAAAMALPLGEHAENALHAPPACPDVEELEQFFRMKGSPVPAFDLDLQTLPEMQGNLRSQRP